jgi:hypothetical protein
MNIPQDLIDAIKKRECVLFVASGLSSQVKRSNGKTLPNWTGFLEELLEWAELKRVPFNSDPSEISQMIKKGNHLMAAEELQELININEFGEFLNEIFRDKDVKPSKSHEILTKIPFRAILTTNYDALIEGAYAVSSGGQIPKSFTPADLNSALSPLRKKEFFVFKLHGDIDRPEGIVLGSRSYNNLMYKSPNYLSFLETLFTTQTVLFIGFGGSDPDFDYLIDRLSTIFSRTLNKHFLLAANNKFNFTEKRRLLLDKRLEVIEYDPKNNHQEVEVFINKVHSLVNNKDSKQTETKETPTYVLVMSSDFEQDSIVGYVDSLPNFQVTMWTSFDRYFDGTSESRKKFLGDLEDDNYEFKPTIAIIELRKESINSVKFEQEIEQALLKELEEKIIIIPVVIGKVEIPFKLRNFQHIRLPEKFSKKDLNALKEILTVYNNVYKT